MKRINTYLLGCLALLCFSCTDNDADMTGTAQGGTTGGRVQVGIDINTPEAYTKMFTRTISEENESVLDGSFVVFAFQDDKLLFTVKTDGEEDYTTNTETNLTEADSEYGDYTDSPSIAWHAADESASSGRLYLEYLETAGTVHLLVLANVDMDTVTTLLEGDTDGTDATITVGMTQETVAAALAPALDFDVTDESLESIPMAGECDLDEGITLGSWGSLSLRRSVAKFTVHVEYTKERVNYDYDGDITKVPFNPTEVQIMNLNSKYATVYASSKDAPNISSRNESDMTDDELPYSPTIYFEEGDWEEGTNDDGEEVYYKEVVFYVAETENSRVAAYSGGVANTENPRISVLVGGTFKDNDEELLENNWYRLDLIPETATSTDEELQYILRNHHYRFVLGNVSKRGSTSDEEAMEMSIPDNFPFDSSGSNDIYVEIEDEDIVSITVEYYTSTDETPYYVGVSSTSIELADSGDACARVKVVTNFDSWTIDESSIPLAYDEDGNEITDSDGNPVYAISFVWDSDAKTLWLWLDYPACVEVGETYSYYIVAGNIRKKMRITIVAAETSDTDSDDGSDADTD